MNTLKSIGKSVINGFNSRSAHYLEIVLGFVLLAHGVVDGWPGTQLPSGAFEFLSNNVAESIFALWQFVSGAFLIAGVWWAERSWARSARRIGSFGAFLAFLFISILGIISVSSPIFWISTLGLAVISGILHIRTGWDDE